MLIRYVVLSLTCLAGFALIERYMLARLKGNHIAIALLIMLYLAVYWALVYAFFM